MPTLPIKTPVAIGTSVPLKAPVCVAKMDPAFVGACTTGYKFVNQLLLPDALANHVCCKFVSTYISPGLIAETCPTGVPVPVKIPGTAKFVLAAVMLATSDKLFALSMKAVEFNVAAVPNPKFVLALDALVKSDRLLAGTRYDVDAGRNAALDMVAAVPRPSAARALAAFVRSDRLFATCKKNDMGSRPALPIPKFVCAAETLARSDRLFAFCRKNVIGSNALPANPKLVCAAERLARSDRLFAVCK